MIKTYKNANGQTVAQDATGVWRIYHLATRSFGVFASAPTAEALKNPIEVQHSASILSPPKPEPKPDPEPYKFVPRAELKAEPQAKSNVWMYAVAAAAVLLLIVGLDRGWFRSAPQHTATYAGPVVPVTNAPPSGPIKAIEVEFIPLNAVKVATHAHPLHGQSCADKSGKKVKVDAGIIGGRQAWDWYRCP